MNDGVCDPTGRFWAGSMAYDGSSPDGSTMFVADTGLEHPAAADGLVLALDLPGLGIEATGRPACAFGSASPP